MRCCSWQSIGWADILSGPLATSLFYIVPIIVIAWRFGFRAASIIVVAAGLVWLWSDLLLGAYDPWVSYWNALSRTVIFGAMGAFVAAVRHDRDRLRELNKQLEDALQRESQSARRDLMSGLPNSRAFEETLSRELARSSRESTAFGIGYMDVDNFKRVNDTLGHPAGDELLRRVAQALFISVREEDYCARLGGDEFAIIIVRPERETYHAIASRIYDRMRELACMYEGLELGATIGFVHFSEPPDDTVAVIRRADEAMYRVKSQHKGTYAVEEATV